MCGGAKAPSYIYVNVNKKLMKNLNFIPLNNDVNKLVAFTPSLDGRWRKNQRIESKPFYTETLDVVKMLQKEGWRVDGSYENRNKASRKIGKHCVRLSHPDLGMKIQGKNEGFANMYLTNSCNGSSPLNMDFGMYRQVCSNGLVVKDIYADSKIKHTEKDYNRLPQIIAGLESKIQPMFRKFEYLKNVTLTDKQMRDLAREASLIRFEQDHKINTDQLLSVRRVEDEGNNLWAVYNRIQENLTQPNMLIDEKGNLISGISNPLVDISINQGLYDLVEAYA